MPIIKAQINRCENYVFIGETSSLLILPGRRGKQAFLKGLMSLASEQLQQARLSDAARTATLSHSTQSHRTTVGPEGT